MRAGDDDDRIKPALGYDAGGSANERLIADSQKLFRSAKPRRRAGSEDDRRDAAALRLAVSQNCAYVGALGPKRRTQRLLQSLPGLDSQKVFAPVGLDIGAESSEEIALAAIAEIQSVLKNRPAGRLSDRSGPIHVPTPSLRIPAGRPA